MIYWPCLRAKTIPTHSLPHAENQHQWSVNDFWACILANLSFALWQWFINRGTVAFSTKTVHDICITPSFKWASMESQNLWSCVLGRQGIARIYELISELLTTFIGKNTIYNRHNTDSKIIDITIRKSCKRELLTAEYMILVRYYYQTVKASAVYESTDGTADNQRNSNRLRDLHRTVNELTVRVHWQHRLPIGQRFGFDPDPDPKWRSGTIADTPHARPCTGCYELPSVL